MFKIAFVTTNDGHPWGGCDELWYHTARLLLKDNHQVAVSIKDWHPMPRQIETLQKDGAVIYKRNIKKKFSRLKSIINRLIPGFLKLKNENSYYRALEDFGPDLVVISQGNNVQGKDWMVACKDKNWKYAPIVQLVSEHNWPDDTNGALLANLYRSAEKTFFISLENLRLTEIMFATQLENAEIVDNPLNVSFEANPTYPDHKAPYSLAYVGRLSFFHKGLDILLEVLALEKWKNRPIEVVLYGNGENKDSLEKLLQKYGIANVRFGGFKENVEEIWKNHQGLICPSRIEGMPMVVVEAMLCNRFCIGTKVGIIPELVNDSENGFLVRAPEAEFLDEAMEKAWAVRDDWEKLGKAAGIKVRERVPPQPVENFVNLLKGLIH